MKKLYISCIMFILLLPLVSLVLGFNSKNYSRQTLSTFPKINISRKTTEQLDNYWQDHFPYRTLMISTVNQIHKFIFNSFLTKEVVHGEKMLFYTETIDDYLGGNQFSEYDYQRILKTIDIQRNYVEKLGSNFVFMVVPNKNSLPQYRDKMPLWLLLFHKQTPITTISNKDDKILNLLPSLSSGDTYLKEDSHWNKVGAYEGFKALMNRLNLPYDTYINPTIAEDTEGDLSILAYPSEVPNEKQFQFENFKQNFVYLRPLRSFDDLYIATKSIRKDAERLVMFRDSYGASIIPYLSNHFSQATYLKSIPFDYRFVEKGNQEHVVFEIVERNLNYLLQKTPILLAPEVDAIATDDLLSHHFDATVQKRDNYYHLNAVYKDQSMKDITEVRIEENGKFYDAFPISDDADILDNQHVLGFSLYLDHPVDNYQVYVKINNSWKKIKND